MEKLQSRTLYHIYNRAIGSEKMFTESAEYDYFLNQFKKYNSINSKVYAYCLMPNHFHFLLEFTHELNNRKFSKQLGDFFNSYTKAFNKKHNRKGSLFIHRYKRKSVLQPDYILRLVCYIHANPVRHGYVNDMLDWKYSSYGSFFTDRESLIRRTDVLEWFESNEKFNEMHAQFLAGDLNLKDPWF